MSEHPEFEYSHQKDENVVIQDLTEWDGRTEGMDHIESEWLEAVRESQITAAVTEFGPEVSLGRETQEHLAKEWTANANEAGINKIAFVSDGIKSHAVSSNIDVEQQIQAFRSLEKAVEWA